MMTEFKVGDKVRVLDVNFIDSPRVISRIDVFEVKHVTNIGGLRTNRLSDGAYLYFATDELRYVELLEVKSSKSERISLLESQVAELQAEVQALQKADKPTVHNVTVNLDSAKSAVDIGKLITEGFAKGLGLAPTPNEQRKAVIERAKAFIEEAKVDLPFNRGKGYVLGEIGRICDVQFIANNDKRTVVALFRWRHDGNVYAKAIAKCDLSDVFNADIGKAIALGRALGLDVSEFENAVKPTEFVKGHTFKTSYDLSDTNIGSVTDVKKADKHGLPIRFYHDIMGGYIPFDKATIIDDTEAQY